MNTFVQREEPVAGGEPPSLATATPSFCEVEQRDGVILNGFDVCGRRFLEKMFVSAAASRDRRFVYGAKHCGDHRGTDTPVRAVYRERTSDTAVFVAPV